MKFCSPLFCVWSATVLRASPTLLGFPSTSLWYHVSFTHKNVGAENANCNILKDGMVILIHLPYGVDVNTYKEDNVPYQNPIQPLYYLSSIISSIYDIWYKSRIC